MVTVKRQVVQTDAQGNVLYFKVEECEWHPVKIPHSRMSKSALALQGLKVGEVKRIVHPELICKVKTYSGNRGRACSLQPTIYKLRKGGWELDFYHEADHIIVVRRTK